MKKQSVTIKNPSGLHARPGKDFVQLAKTFESEIFLEKGEEVYNGKSLLKLMQAGLSQHDEVILVANGVDEDAALAALVDYMANLVE